MQLKIENTKAVFSISPFSKLGGRIFSLLDESARWLKHGQGIQFLPSDSNIEVIKKEIPSIEIIDERNKELEWDKFDESSPYIPKTEIRDYQKAALRKIGNRQHFALFMEVGTGKTKIAIDRAGFLFAKKQISAVFVIAPLGVHRQWVESAYPEHSGVPFKGFFWPLKEFTNDLLPGKELKVFTINWEGIRTEDGMKASQSFLNFHKGRVLIVADESHIIKDSTNKTHKAALALGMNCTHRMMLTGTPIAVNLIDEWSQFNWLDTRILNIKYVSHFINEYCLTGGFKGKAVIGQKNVEKYREIIDPYVFVATKADIGLQPASTDLWHFDLLPKQKDMIKHIRKEQKALLDSGEFDIANGAVAANKIQQITNGFYLEQGVLEWLADPQDNPRLMALKQFIDSRPNEKLIVWARYKADVELIKRLLGDVACVYGGEDRQAALSLFLDPESPCKVFISNPATGGTGIDGLQKVCCTDIYYSMNDNFIQKTQSEGRIDRSGSCGPVTHYYLIAKGGQDMRILSRHKMKKDIHDMTHGEWKTFFDDDDANVWEKAK